MDSIKEQYLLRFNHNEELQRRIEVELKELKDDSERNDYCTCFLFNEISADVKSLVFKNFQVKENEKLLFFKVKTSEAFTFAFWNPSKIKATTLRYCYLITDTGFYYKENDVVTSERWENIDEFEQGKYSRFIIYACTKSSRIPIRLLEGEREKIEKYKKLLKDISIYYKKIFVYRLFSERDSELALEWICSILKSNVDIPILRYDKGMTIMDIIAKGKKRILWGLFKVSLKLKEIESLTDEAEHEFDTLIYSKKIDPDLERSLPMMYYQKSKIAKYRRHVILQRRFLIKAFSTDDYTLQNQIKKDLMEADSNIRDVYTDMDYNERKIIMLVKEINKECSTNTIEVFKIDNYPSKIQFPKGHPKLGELYIGHPYRNNLYIPYANHEFQFFLDKVYEYCQLLQALGATEITIESIRGKNVSELQKYNFNASGGASYGPAAKVNAEYNEKKESSSKSSVDNYLKEYRKMDPMSLPHIPDNLIWYPEQTNWQRLASQRTNNNNLLEFEEEFSTKETSFVSASEEESIKADLQILKVDANISVNENNFKQSEKNEETVWRIKVKFKSLADFVISKSGMPSNFMLSQNEDSYRAEVLYCIKENAGISEIDRRILNRKREQLGITEERAREIENSCLPKYTDSEREYLGILEALDGLDLNDPIVQKRIIRERSLLNISEQRADELEAQFNKRKNE